MADAHRPRSANHSGRNATIALAREIGSQERGDPHSRRHRGSGRLLNGGDFADLAGHRGNAVASVGGQCLQQAQVL